MSIDIVYYNEGEDSALWLRELSRALPYARIRQWHSGDSASADYALLWHAPKQMLNSMSSVKAIINLAAGVDQLLADLPDHLKQTPIYRLEDAGMAQQMIEYVLHAVIRYFRSFDQYDRQANQRIWQELSVNNKKDFPIGVMGVGVMGRAVISALQSLGFSVRAWARTSKTFHAFDYYSGQLQLPDFLKGLRVLVCLLPLTEQTQKIINSEVLNQLQPKSFLINVARGKHLVESDLLKAIKSGQIQAATLDVTTVEPLPQNHPFWDNERITLTPHIAALTECKQTVEQVAKIIEAVHNGKTISALVDTQLGY